MEEDLCDSAKANRILKAVIGSLEPDDVAYVIGLLQQADLIDNDEARTISASIADGGNEAGGGEMASDAQIMKKRRQQVLAGLRPASCLHEPIYRQPTAEDEKRFREMFPGASRIKQAF